MTTDYNRLHQELVARAMGVVKYLPVLWKRDGSINPGLLVWPGIGVTSDEGQKISGVCALDLTDIPKECWNKAMHDLVIRTKACGLLFIEQTPTAIEATFETPQGSCLWSLEIERHGDVLVLKEPKYIKGRGLDVLRSSSGITH